MLKYIEELILAEGMIKVIEHYFEITFPIWVFMALVYVIILRRLFLHAFDAVEKGKSTRIVNKAIVALIGIPLGMASTVVFFYFNVPIWIQSSIVFLLVSIVIYRRKRKDKNAQSTDS